jgi:hypothetical protein
MAHQKSYKIISNTNLSHGIFSGVSRCKPVF